MPTILTHPAVPVTLALALGPRIIPPRLMLAGIAASIVPDLDVFIRHLGIAYSYDYGHRGFSHSLAFAALAALTAACACRWLHASYARAAAFLFIAMASHGALDAFTNGGSGIAFLWPFSGERFFAPVQPIEVSPISLQRFLSERGLRVLASKLAWIWAPCAVLVVIAWNARRRRQS